MTEHAVEAKRELGEEYLRKSAGAYSNPDALRQIEQARAIEGGRRAA